MAAVAGAAVGGGVGAAKSKPLVCKGNEYKDISLTKKGCYGIEDKPNRVMAYIKHPDSFKEVHFSPQFTCTISLENAFMFYELVAYYDEIIPRVIHEISEITKVFSSLSGSFTLSTTLKSIFYYILYNYYCSKKYFDDKKKDKDKQKFIYYKAAFNLKPRTNPITLFSEEVKLELQKQNEILEQFDDIDSILELLIQYGIIRNIIDNILTHKKPFIEGSLDAELLQIYEWPNETVVPDKNTISIEIRYFKDFESGTNGGDSKNNYFIDDFIPAITKVVAKLTTHFRDMVWGVELETSLLVEACGKTEKEIVFEKPKLNVKCTYELVNIIDRHLGPYEDCLNRHDSDTCNSCIFSIEYIIGVFRGNEIQKFYQSIDYISDTYPREIIKNTTKFSNHHYRNLGKRKNTKNIKRTKKRPTKKTKTKKGNRK
jgi:hypothetical protein